MHRQLFGWHASHVHMQVDAIGERARQSIAMPLELRGAAPTWFVVTAGVAARTGIARGNEHEARGKSHRLRSANDGDVSVLEWLTQRFQCRSREQRQFVQEQHAAMRETHFTGTWPAASTNQTSGGYRMMRRAKRSDRKVWCTGRAEQTCNGVNREDLQRFVVSERRHDAGKSSREHRLPCTRWPDEQDIVCTRRRDFECANGVILSDDFTKLRCNVSIVVCNARSCFCAQQPITQRGDEFCKGARRCGACVGDAQRFTKVVWWNDEQCIARCGNVSCDGERSAHGAQLPVQTKFTDGTHALQRLGWQLSTRGEQGEGYREIECGTGFWSVSGLEIHGDASWRYCESGVSQRRPDAIAALLHCRRGQTDERPLWQPVGYVNFDEDIDGIDAEDGGGLCGGKHGVKMWASSPSSVTIASQLVSNVCKHSRMNTRLFALTFLTLTACTPAGSGPTADLTGEYASVSESSCNVVLALMPKGLATVTHSCRAENGSGKDQSTERRGSWTFKETDITIRYDGLTERLEFDDAVPYAAFGRRGAGPGIRVIDATGSGSLLAGYSTLWKRPFDTSNN